MLNFMFLNLGSNIRTNMLWPLFLSYLSYACRKEIKGRKTSRICHFIWTSSSFNSWLKKSSSIRLSRIGWNVNSFKISQNLDVTNYKTSKSNQSNQCPWLWFKTQPLIIRDRNFTTTSHATHIIRNGTWDCNATNYVM